MIESGEFDTDYSIIIHNPLEAMIDVQHSRQNAVVGCTKREPVPKQDLNMRAKIKS